MKTKSIFFTIIIFYLNHSYSQIYHQLPIDNTVKWSCSYQQLNGTSSGTDNYNSNYKAMKDTIINGKNYSKIQENTSVDYGAGPVGGNIPEYIYLRNDSLNRKVYQLNTSTSMDELLYDFDLVLGDTIKTIIGGYVSGSSDNYIVDSIDSVSVNGRMHKRFLLRGTYALPNQTWLIEGIGCSGHLIRGLDGFELTSQFSCYSEAGSVQYGDIACTFTVSIDENTQDFDFVFFPNPVINKFNVSIKEKAELLEVYNSSGSLVFSESNLSKGLNTINVNHIGAGIYTVKLKSEKGVAMKKFVKN